MDKIDGSRFNTQKVQTDWFEFKRLQTEEQLKINTTVQAKTANVKAELRKPEQQQIASFQDTRSPFQEVDNASSGLQKLLGFSSMNNSTSVQMDLDLDALVSSMRNQFQMQTFSGKEFETLLALLKKNPENIMMKNAIVDVLRAFSAAQTANAAQNTMESAIDNLIVLLKNDGTFQLQLKNQGNLENKSGEPLSISILKQHRKYDTYSSTIKDMLHQIQSSVSEESSISKTIDRIFGAMKRLEEAQRFDLNDAVEKLLNVPVKNQPETPDKLTMLLQKAMGLGNSEEKIGGNTFAQQLQSMKIVQELIQKALLSPGKNGLEDAITLINQLKKQYPHSQVIQNLSAQTLSGLTVNLLSNQPMLHFFLKSFLDNSPHFADVWVDPDYEEDNEKVVKMLLSVDLESAESFEVELKLNGKMLFAKVLCPESYVEDMQEIKKVIREQANGFGYSVPNLSIGVLSGKHALEEIFGKKRGGRRSFNARV